MAYGFQNKVLKEPRNDKVVTALSYRLAMVASDYEPGEVVVAGINLAVIASKQNNLATLAACLEEAAERIRRGEIK